MMEWLSKLVEQFAAQSALELVAVVLAIGYVWLAARQNIWCWPCALISTSIYVWLFSEVSLPFHTLLNIFYVVMAIYGWWHWRESLNQQLVVTRWQARKHLYAVILLLAAGLILGTVADNLFDPNYAYLDALITVFSVFTTFLMAHKVLENWLYWIVINSFAAYLYFSIDLLPTAMLFVIYTLFAIYGYFSWCQQQKLGKLADSSV